MEKGRARLTEEDQGPESVPGGTDMVDFVDFREDQGRNEDMGEEYDQGEDEQEQPVEPRRRPDENFKTGAFMKEYYSEAFSFSKEHEGLADHDGKRQHAPIPEQPEDGSGGFQQMKSRSQAAMSSAQIIKYHNFVAKRAKKVFTTLLKGYSPV